MSQKQIDGSKKSEDGRPALADSSRRSSFALGPKLASVRIASCPAVVEKLTSEVFGAKNPPMDWADMGLLIPHEAIRRQMKMMVQSAAAMPDDPSDGEPWKATLFARWYTEYFFVCVHEHHDAEEKIYFPWIKTKAGYPEKEWSKGHEDLMSDMGKMKGACETIIKKKGKGCSSEIAMLKTAVPAFEKDMNDHLREEEEVVPGLLRDNFTQEEEGEVVEKILQAGGLEMAKKFLPAILAAMREYAKPEFYDEFVGSMPPPIKHLVFKYFEPDFENVICPMRDAPTLAKKPPLKRVGCCGISFCFPCIL